MLSLSLAVCAAAFFYPVPYLLFTYSQQKTYTPRGL